MSAAFLLFSSLLIRIFWPRWKPDIHWICPALAIALPFSTGGFHIATSAVMALFLTIALLEQLRKNNSVRIYISPISVSVFLLFLFYCATPLWAADQGMAAIALPKYLPLVLFILFLMQVTDNTQQQILHMIPVCGCLMTLVSILSLASPVLYHNVTVNGRLAGFFQYPNSFAAFLLVGLIVQGFHIRRKIHFFICFLLMIGIVLSGSKTVFVLMLLFMAAIALTKRQTSLTSILSVALICSLGTGIVADKLNLLSNADRFTDIRASSGTFLVRLLYFRDVLPSILSSPFGIGYMGYPAIEGSIQTGRYYVSYIHNGLLQLLLEAGWLPGILIAPSLFSFLFSSKTPIMQRFILLAVLAHCMLDFDLQFCIFWILLLSCVDIHKGRMLVIKQINIIRFAAAILAASSLWLGCGDLLYRTEKPDLCLRIVPFHTEALTYQMSVSKDIQEMDHMADQILSLNPIHSLALSAKANVAFSKGDISAMIQHKEAAIQSSRYSTAEYCDYFEKLYTAMQTYLQAGDMSSAVYCRNKLLQIPEMMAAVSQETHPLAAMTGDDSSLALPPEYVTILQQLQ